MDDYLLSGENIIETKGANFLLHLDESGLRRFGVFGVDAEMRLLGLGEGKESIGESGISVSLWTAFAEALLFNTGVKMKKSVNKLSFE